MKSGKVQFSPVCANKWQKVCSLKGNPGACQKCQHKQPAFIDETLIRRHMNGKSRFGIYPALPNGMVHFVVADLDGHQPGQNAKADTKTIIRIASDMSIPITVISSNSGTGYHVYLFFSAPTEYRKAAGIMGTILDRCPGLSALDCVKPSRATDAGTGGGLIALPFHRAAYEARRATVPVDGNLDPMADTFEDCLDYFEREYDPITPERVSEIISEFSIDISEKPNAEPIDAALLSGMKGDLPACIKHILSKNPKTEKSNFNKLSMTVIKFMQGSGYSLEKALSACSFFLNSYPHSGTYTTQQARTEHFRELWVYLYGRTTAGFLVHLFLG
jgi:hypothetical protein